MLFRSAFARFRSPDAAPRFLAVPQALPPIKELGLDYAPYRPLFAAPSEAGHAHIAGWEVEGDLIVTEPRGFLRPADALTLFDLARYQGGDVLEIGSAWGLSATILCRGVAGRRAGGRVVSLELDPLFQVATRRAVKRNGLSRWHSMRGGDGTALMEQAIAKGETYGTIFIDHDHGLAASAAACRLLPHLLAPGGLALFHDFNDPLNASGEYGIYAAVSAFLATDPRFAFYGMPGCCALIGWAR
jgi:predicted O-methyltransferase YrrM